MDRDYSKREIDHLFCDISTRLDLILEQTTKHNGRLTRVERILTVLGAVTSTVLIMNGSELVKFISTIFF